MSAPAIALSDAALRRRIEYQRQLARSLCEVDAALDVLRARLDGEDGARPDRGHRLFLALRDRRRNLDVSLEELMRVPEEEWGWQRNELENASGGLRDLVEAALSRCLSRPAAPDLTPTRA